MFLSACVVYRRSLHAQLEIAELGSGVGLPGILAAAFARHVTLTDYVDSVVDNIRYNIRVNSALPADDEWDPDYNDEQRSTARRLRPRIGQCTSVKCVCCS